MKTIHTALLTLLGMTAANAAVIITVEEIGGDVSIISSGTINLTGLTPGTIGGNPFGGS